MWFRRQGRRPEAGITKVSDDSPFSFEWVYRTGAQRAIAIPDAMMLTCCDGRYTACHDEMVRRYLAKKYGFHTPHRVACPGSVGLALRDPTFLQSLGDLYLLHQIPKHIGITHEGCGWYQAVYPDMDRDERLILQCMQALEFRETLKSLLNSMRSASDVSLPVAAVDVYLVRPDKEHHAHLTRIVPNKE